MPYTCSRCYLAFWVRLGVARAGDLVNVSLQQLTSVGVKKLHARRLKSDPVVFLDAQQVPFSVLVSYAKERKYSIGGKKKNRENKEGFCAFRDYFEF